MAITIFVSWLNLAGYFIGDQMVGGAENQNRDFLLLQIAAKVTVCIHPVGHLMALSCRPSHISRICFAYKIRSLGVVCGRIFGDSNHGCRQSSSHVCTWHTPWIAQLSL